MRLPGSGLLTEDYGDDATAPQILIHRSGGWADIFEVGLASAPDQHFETARLRHHLDRAMRDPERLLFAHAAAKSSLTGPWLSKVLTFHGGNGIRALVQWDCEPSLICQGRLHYLFVGMSKDNSCYVIATIPVTLPGLPSYDDPLAEHLGFSTSAYEQLVEKWGAYFRLAGQWLAAHQSEIQPRLGALDSMLQSMAVHTWN